MLDFIQKENLHKVAIIFDNKIKTYQELNKDIREMEEILTPKEVIFLLCNNSYECLLIYLACLRKGSIPLLLSDNINELHLKNYQLRFLPSQIFSPKKLNILSEKSYLIKNYFLYKESKDNYINNKNLAVLLTTSGSTGNPKVVKVSRQNLISNTNSICKYLNLSNKERHITTLPMNYTYGLSCINTFLNSGASIILNNHAITTKQFWQNVEKYKPTYLSGVPFTYEVLSKYFLDKLRYSSFRVFTQAGGKLNNRFIEKFILLMNETNKEFIVMYGQTEATARMSYLPSSKLKEKIGSIGIAIPGGEFYLRNTYFEKENPQKTIGELVYRGENVTEGYANSFEQLNKSEENNFILNTGDIAWIDKENYIYLVGRINRFAKINGIRVSLIDVENLVKDLGYTCAISSDDLDLKIYLEIDDIKLEIPEIKKKISNKINISPNSIRLLRINKIPRLDSGKINYKKLGENND